MKRICLMATACLLIAGGCWIRNQQLVTAGVQLLMVTMNDC
ncbi:hypothetical protein [Secundilactobacillus oryzae]|nr:hypothetical protein [Secundilactobacillus oryzae]